MLVLTNQTISSLDISEITGKQHKHVLRDIQNLNKIYEKLGQPNFGPSSYLNSQNKIQTCFKLTKIQCLDLLTGYDISLRIKVIRRWEELENQRTIDFANPETVKQLVGNWYDEQQKRLNAENQIRILEAKTELMDKVLDCDEKIDVGQAAKILDLKIGRNTLFKLLRETGVFFKERNEPKQEYIDKNFFVLKEVYIERNSHDGFTTTKVLVTQKGLEFIDQHVKSIPAQTFLANYTF